MSFLLLTGIILLVIPFLTICGFSVAIFVQMVRDDRDARAIFNMALGLMVFGFGLIMAYLGTTLVK